MTTLALYRSRLPSLLSPLKMASLALAMIGILQVRAAGLGPQLMAGLALFYRLAFTPDVAPPLILMMALGARYLPGFVEPVAELYRRLPPGSRDGDFQETAGRGLAERAGLDPPDAQQPQDQSRHIG